MSSTTTTDTSPTRRVARIARLIGVRLLQAIQIAASAVVIVMLALAGANLVADASPPSLPSNPIDEKAFFFELDGVDKHWENWQVVTASVEYFPLSNTGPFDLFPQPNGLRVEIQVYARTTLPVVDGSSFMDVQSLLVHVPDGATASVASDIDRAYFIDTYRAQLGLGPALGMQNMVAPPPANPEGDGYFRSNPLIHQFGPHDETGESNDFLAVWAVVLTVPDTMVDRTGLFSGTSRITWQPQLAAFDVGIGDAETTTLGFLSCNCGLVSHSPEPTARNTDSTEWRGLAYRTNVTFEMSSDSWVDSTSAWLNSVLVPAVLGVAATWVFSWGRWVAGKGRHRRERA